MSKELDGNREILQVINCVFIHVHDQKLLVVKLRGIAEVWRRRKGRPSVRDKKNK